MVNNHRFPRQLHSTEAVATNTPVFSSPDNALGIRFITDIRSHEGHLEELCSLADWGLSDASLSDAPTIVSFDEDGTK